MRKITNDIFFERNEKSSFALQVYTARTMTHEFDSLWIDVPDNENLEWRMARYRDPEGAKVDDIIDEGDWLYGKLLQIGYSGDAFDVLARYIGSRLPHNEVRIIRMDEDDLVPYKEDGIGRTVRVVEIEYVTGGGRHIPEPNVEDR